MHIAYFFIPLLYLPAKLYNASQYPPRPNAICDDTVPQLLAGWLAGLLAGWLAGWLAGLLAGWLAKGGRVGDAPR
jgi:predicted lipid-binding transport protein (Tim44 family)